MKKSMLGKLIGAALFTLTTQTVMADDIKLKTTKVRDNIYMIEGVNGFAGGNIAASVGEDGLLIVDSLLTGRTAQLNESLTKIGSDKLRYVLNTHYHGDHTGGNAVLSLQAPIIAHDNVRKRLVITKDEDGKASNPASWPVLTFNDTMTMHFNGDTIKLKHYPSGHTDGDSMVYFTKANVLHMGDHYFKGIFPYVDIPSGGNVLGLADNVATVIAKMPKDVMIIPGHGDLATLDELKQYHKMLLTSIDRVGKAMKAGKSQDEIVAQGLGDKMKAWGKGFIPEIRWIGFVYQSIQQRAGLKAEHSHDGATHHH